jgi:hypothetical protein
MDMSIKPQILYIHELQSQEPTLTPEKSIHVTTNEWIILKGNLDHPSTDIFISETRK